MYRTLTLGSCKIAKLITYCGIEAVRLMMSRVQTIRTANKTSTKTFVRRRVESPDEACPSHTRGSASVVHTLAGLHSPGIAEDFCVD